MDADEPFRKERLFASGQLLSVALLLPFEKRARFTTGGLPWLAHVERFLSAKDDDEKSQWFQKPTKKDHNEQQSESQKRGAPPL